MVTTYTEHTRSRNMEATFRGNHNTIVCRRPGTAVGGERGGRAGAIVFFDHLMICTYKVQKMEATFRGNHKNIV